jgi:hypothetical protein
MEFLIHRRRAVNSLENVKTSFFVEEQISEFMADGKTRNILHETLSKQVRLEIAKYIDELNSEHVDHFELLKKASGIIGRVCDQLFVYNNLIEGIKSGQNFGKLVTLLQKEGLLNEYDSYEEDKNLVGNIGACPSNS